MDVKKAGKVFILDDDLLFLELCKSFLETRGFKVFAEAKVDKFLQYIQSEIPDVVVLDVNMPEASGWEVLHLLRKIFKTYVPVILTTVEADKELAAAKGIAHYFSKPLDLSRLAEVIGAYCEGGKKHDVLMIEDYQPFELPWREDIRNNGWSCFGVCDFLAAGLYLQKNSPKVVCVGTSKERFDKFRDKLEHPKVIYVENRQEIKKLALHLG